MSRLSIESIAGTLERKGGDKSDSSGCSSCECSECREQGDVCYSCSLYNESSNAGSVRYVKALYGIFSPDSSDNYFYII